MAAMYDFSVLRDLRRREGMTIADVSGRSGISPAVISRLERNQAQAGLATLYKLGRVFAINASDLLSLLELPSSHRKHETSHRSGGILFREIAYNNARCMFGKGRKGQSLARPEIHRDDYETCWVLQGAVEIALPNERHVLRAGEATQFDAVLDHSYRVVEDCTMIIQHIAKPKRL
jgi:transcriptional regulator with XRE-family HTH domain